MNWPDERTDLVLELQAAQGPHKTLRSQLSGSDLGARHSQATIGRAVDALIRLCGGRRPVVLLDDAQLADHATMAVLRGLHRQAGSVLLTSQLAPVPAGSGRPDPLDCLRYEPGFTLLKVPPFTEDEVGEVMSDALGGPVAHPATAALHAATCGNPALLNRFFAMGGLRTAMTRRADGWRLDGTPQQGVELSPQGRHQLRTAIGNAWRILALGTLDQLCRLANFAGEVTIVSAIWPQTLLLRGRPMQALRYLDDTEAQSSQARALARAFVLAFGLGHVEEACGHLTDVAHAAPAWAPRLDPARAWLLATAGDAAEADAVLAELTPGRDDEGTVFAQAALAATALVDNRPAAAVSALRRALIGAAPRRAAVVPDGPSDRQPPADRPDQQGHRGVPRAPRWQRLGRGRLTGGHASGNLPHDMNAG